MAWYFEEGAVLLGRGWYRTLKRAVWYFKEGGVLRLKRVVCYFEEGAT